jgi:hypothetical protein
MRRPLLLVLVVSAATTAGCASFTQLAPQERSAIERELTGPESQKFLKLSYYVTPFFGDASKKLLTHVPPEEVRLLNHPNGEPVNPGPVQKVLPAGRRVRITKVEFPTSWAVTERVLYTPRSQPWIYLEVADEPRTHPFILVLRSKIQSQDEFLAEVGRFLSDRDPQPLLEGFSDSVREGIRKKAAVTDMPAEALEMAWGYPELKRIDAPNRKEMWVYPGRRRIAYLVDGRLERTEAGTH